MIFDFRIFGSNRFVVKPVQYIPLLSWGTVSAFKLAASIEEKGTPVSESLISGMLFDRIWFMASSKVKSMPSAVLGGTHWLESSAKGLSLVFSIPHTFSAEGIVSGMVKIVLSTGTEIGESWGYSTTGSVSSVICSNP